MVFIFHTINEMSEIKKAGQIREFTLLFLFINTIKIPALKVVRQVLKGSFYCFRVI